jgi:hypothetical protein
MTFDKDKWEAVYKQVATVQASKGHGPSDGIVCIHATLKFIAAGLKDDVGGPTVDKDTCEQVDESFKELYESACAAKTLSGFASNASSAAKACELATSSKASAFSDF